VMGTHQPYGGLLRDTLHMNTNGSMVAGQIFNDFFAPIPEPAGLALAAMGAAAVGLRRRRA
jgi:hypothetical protein